PGVIPDSVYRCQGVDLNRNFNGYDSWKHESSCGDTYAGTEAFSEPETQALRAHIENIKTRHVLGGAIDLHAYAQWIMYPPGYAFSSPLSPNDGELRETGLEMQRRILATHSGRRYSVTTATDFYPATGAMDDWMYDKATVSVPTNSSDSGDQHGLVFTVELAPNDASANGNGFIVEPTQIVPTGWEVWNVLRVLIQQTEKYSDAETMNRTVLVANEDTILYDSPNVTNAGATAVSAGSEIIAIRGSFDQEGALQSMQTLNGSYQYFDIDHFTINSGV
ncbi:hypothetical protein SARC_06294, partial [Sphaeroforma arctica JP610]